MSGSHRVHHRYTDSSFDPYNSNGGFWYAHIGWMLIKPKPENFKYSDISDLRENKFIEWQHKNYYWFAPFISFIIPTFIIPDLRKKKGVNILLNKNKSKILIMNLREY